jgi:hypothetical protein
MKKGDIVAVVTIAGEYVGKYHTTIEGNIQLDDPRMLVQSQQGMGFAQGICVTGEMNPAKVVFSQYVFVTPVNDDIEKAYRQATSGLVI